MNTQTNQIITKQELKALLTIKSDTAIRNLEKRDPTFPQKIKLGLRRVGYRLEEVNSWIEARGTAEEARNAK